MTNPVSESGQIAHTHDEGGSWHAHEGDQHDGHEHGILHSHGLASHEHPLDPDRLYHDHDADTPPTPDPMDPWRKTIEHNFAYHPPRPGSDDAERHERVREGCKALALFLTNQCPQSRELGEALQTLEGVMMYANAAIARHASDLPEVLTAELRAMGHIKTFSQWAQPLPGGLGPIYGARGVGEDASAAYWEPQLNERMQKMTCAEIRDALDLFEVYRTEESTDDEAGCTGCPEDEPTIDIDRKAEIAEHLREAARALVNGEPDVAQGYFKAIADGIEDGDLDPVTVSASATRLPVGIVDAPEKATRFTFAPADEMPTLAAALDLLTGSSAYELGELCGMTGASVAVEPRGSMFMLTVRNRPSFLRRLFGAS